MRAANEARAATMAELERREEVRARDREKYIEELHVYCDKEIGLACSNGLDYCYIDIRNDERELSSIFKTITTEVLLRNGYIVSGPSPHEGSSGKVARATIKW